MAMTPPATTAVGAAPAVDTASVVELLRMFYVSEVYGAAANSYMQRAYNGLNDEQRHKLEACRLLMVETSERLLVHLTSDLGVVVRPPTRAEEMAPLIANLPFGSWHDRVMALEQICVRGVEAYRKLRGLYGESEPLLCASLMAKEIAVRDFARDELDGEVERSLDRIVGLLGPEAQQQLRQFDAAQTARGG
jgi:hypothetical protein